MNNKTRILKGKIHNYCLDCPFSNYTEYEEPQNGYEMTPYCEELQVELTQIPACKEGYEYYQGLKIVNALRSANNGKDD